MTQIQAPNITPRVYLLLLTLLIALGIFLRFYSLDSRPVHHDESLHGTYARYAVENPEKSFYQYNPMLHGPLMYNCIADLFYLFGTSTFVMRSLNAFLGSLFLFSPLLFRRYLSRPAVIWSTAALSLSPGLIYWSRFVHHDYLVLTSYLILATGLLLASRRAGIILVLISFALQYTIKANIFVFAALLVGFLVFESLYAIYTKSKNPSYAKAIFRALKENQLALLAGATIASVIFCALYSGNFRYPEGILDGLYRKVFAYWIEQHHIQRLDGPFSFHLFVLAIYELPLLVAFIAANYLSVKSLPTFQRKVVSVLTGLFLVVPFLVNSSLFETGILIQYLKVKSPFDLFICLEVAVLAVVLSIHFLKQNKRALSFFCYLSLATLWTYSFLGEKVPWLTIYPQVSALIFIVLLFDDKNLFETSVLSLTKPISVSRSLSFLSSLALTLCTICIIEGQIFGDVDAVSIPALRWLGWSVFGLVIFTTLEMMKVTAKLPALLFSLFVSLSLYTAVLTNYTRAGDKREIFSQVHTNPEIHQLFVKLVDYLADPLGKTPKVVLVSGDSVWPATWYFRNLPGYKFTAQKSEYSNFDYLVVDEKDDGVNDNFEVEEIPLQSWWVPNYSLFRAKNLLIYYFTHEPWNPTGSLMVKFARPLETAEEIVGEPEDVVEEEEVLPEDEATQSTLEEGTVEEEEVTEETN